MSNSPASKPEQKAIGFQIARIRTTGFKLNEYNHRPDEPQRSIKLELQYRTEFNIGTNILSITIRCYLHYDGELTPENILADIEVENLFVVEELYKHVIDGQEDLPAEIWVNMFGLSVSHTRALVSERIAGTTLTNTIIPIINPVELTKAFLPHKFESEDQE